MLSRLLTFTVSVATLFTNFDAYARQIPVVDGVIGGVRTTSRPLNVDVAFAPAATTPGKLRVVENSGICETTPGVYQASGYGDLTSSESIW